MPEQQHQDQDEMTARLKLIEAMMGLGLTMWCLWLMIPEHRRQLLKMGMIARAERAARAAAHRAGVPAMGFELATGQRNYTLPYVLSLLSDRLAASYERARGVTPLPEWQRTST